MVNFTSEYSDLVLSRIARFGSNGKFSDIRINIVGTKYNCHRLVLSAASEYFDKVFSENSAAAEVKLTGIGKDEFEGILRFVYTGEVHISTSNIYHLLCLASTYKLSEMERLCVAFVQENLEAVTEDVLEMYSFAHRANNKELVSILSLHIHQHFEHYSRNNPSRYTKLSEESLFQVLNVKPTHPVVQDAYLDGISSWVAAQIGFTVQERANSARRLLKTVDFSKLSADYSHHRMLRSLTSNAGIPPLKTPSTNDGMDVESLNEVQTTLRLVHAYVSRRPKKGLSTVHVFTLRMNGFRSKKWEYGGELVMPHCRIDFMKNTVIDDRLYSMTCAKNVNTFYHTSSISMYPKAFLEPPPIVLTEFDMCGGENNIFVCSKNEISILGHLQSSTVSKFTKSALKRGIFMYKRDADRWFSLPSPRMRYYNACMTCVENVVFLIGGSNSNKSCQGYDPRAKEWFPLPYSTGMYIDAACCVYENKVCVAGGYENPTQCELYDPISGDWQQLKSLPFSRCGKHQLVSWNWHTSKIQRLLSYSTNALSCDRKIVTYFRSDADNHDIGNWYKTTDLMEAVDSTPGMGEYEDCRILDMVYF